jgi:hypothetical protein
MYSKRTGTRELIEPNLLDKAAGALLFVLATVATVTHVGRRAGEGSDWRLTDA